MLTRLAEAFDRLIALATPRCPECHAPMTERAAETAPTPAAPFEIVFACDRCGGRLVEHVVWAIPD